MAWVSVRRRGYWRIWGGRNEGDWNVKALGSHYGDDTSSETSGGHFLWHACISGEAMIRHTSDGVFFLLPFLVQIHSFPPSPEAWSGPLTYPLEHVAETV